MMNTPKVTNVNTTVSPILSWVKTLWEVKKPIVVTTGSNVTGITVAKPIAIKTGTQTTGFFLGLWTSIKTWFINLTTSDKPIITTTGSVTTGAVSLTGSTDTGNTLSWFNDIIGEDTGTVIEPESTGTQTTTGTTVKKPTTKKTTTHTTNSDRDPVLDALF